MKIRQATKNDLPQIHDLVGELAEYEKARHQFTATLQDYEEDFEAGIFEALVAEDNGTIQGIALYYMTYSTWKGKMLYLEDFVVLQHLRRTGIGQQLFDAFIDKAKEKKCTIVRWQVLDWNESAIKFYQKNDATIEDEWLTCKIIFE